MGCGASSDQPIATGATTATTTPTATTAGNNSNTKQENYKAPDSPAKTEGEGGNGGATDNTTIKPTPSTTAAEANADSHVLSDSTVKGIGSAISTTNTVVGVADSVASGVAGALASKNPDGTWTLKSNLGPIPMDSPFLKSISTALVFGCSTALQATQAGKVLFTVLDAVFKMYMSSRNKPQWLADFMLYLAVIESEIRAGMEQFKRQGFILLIADEVESVKLTLQTIKGRGTLTSFVFAGGDQESLQQVRINIEKLKLQALNGMFAEIKEDTAEINTNLRQIIADIKRQRDSTYNSSDDSEEVKQQLEELRKTKLLPALLSPLRFDADVQSYHHRFCKGTRSDILAEFKSWTRVKPEWYLLPDKGGYNESEERVFLIAGLPGTGKSTLAGEIAHSYASIIYASHFCDHALPSRSDPMAALKSLLYQLITTVPALKAWFIGKLTEKDSTVESQFRKGGYTSVSGFFDEMFGRGLFEVQAQANKALKEAQAANQPEPQLAVKSILPQCVTAGTQVITESSPISSSSSSSSSSTTSAASEVVANLPPSKMLILIDSLDESGSNLHKSDKADDLVALLSNKKLLEKLPPWLGFVVTTRLEDRIMNGLQRYRVHELTQDSPRNKSDLELYLRASITSLIQPTTDLESALQIMLHKSEGNFLYASMILENHTSTLTLRDVESWPVGMNDWFSQTLNHLKSHPTYADTNSDVTGSIEELPSTPSWAHVMWIFRFVFAAHEPLRVSALAELLHTPIDVIQQALIPLRSILPLQQTANGPPSSATIRVFHRSLRDWLISEDRKQDDDYELFVDLNKPYAVLSDVCIKRLFVDPSTVQCANSGAPGSLFPLIRFDELLQSTDPATEAATTGLDLYAIRWAGRHLLSLEPAKAHAPLRGLYCSLQFLQLRLERDQVHDFLRDFWAVYHGLKWLTSPVTLRDDPTLEVSPSWVSVRKARKVPVIDLVAFHDLKRFLQAEIRHLTHGMSQEPQPGLTFQYAASYPDSHVACKQANQPDLLPFWTQSKHSVDHIIWKNKPQQLSSMIESWTDIEEEILSLAYHPNQHSKRVLTGASNGSITLWNTETAEVERHWKNVGAGRCTGVAFMLLGTVVASVSADGKIRAWDTNKADDEPIAVIPPEPSQIEDSIVENDESALKAQPGPLTSITFSSDDENQFIVVGSEDGNVYVYERKTIRLKAILKGTSNAGVTAVAYSHRIDDTPSFVVATSKDGSTRKWIFHPLTCEAIEPPQLFPKHDASVDAVAIAPNNAVIAVGTKDSLVIVYDISTGRPLRAPFVGHLDSVTSVDFNPNTIDGLQLASGSADETVRLWRVSDGTCLSLYAAHHKPVQSVRFSPSGKRIGSGSLDESVRIWDATIYVPETYQANSVKDNTCWNVTALSFSANGHEILSGSQDKILRGWNADTGEMIFSVPDLPFVPNHLAQYGEGDNRRDILASKEATDIYVYSSTQVLTHTTVPAGRILALGLSADGTHVVCGRDNNVVQLYELTPDGSVLRDKWSLVMDDLITSVSFSGSSNEIVFVGLQDSSSVTITNGQPAPPVHLALFAGAEDSPFKSSAGGRTITSNSPFLSSTGHLIMAVSDSTGRTTITSEGTILATFPSTGVLQNMGVSVLHWYDAESLIIAGNNRAIFRWNWSQGSASTVVPYECFGHDDRITCLTSHSGTMRFVSGSEDNDILVWDMKEVNRSSPTSPPVTLSNSSTHDSSPLPLHSFLFESERAPTTGSMHLYSCRPAVASLILPTNSAR